MGVYDSGNTGELAQAERERVQLEEAQRQMQQRKVSAIQAHARRMAEHTEQIKKNKERIRKLRRLRNLRCLGCGCGGCLVPGLIIFGCVAVIAIAYGIMEGTVAGQIVGKVLSFFNSELAEIISAMKK